MRLCFTAGSYAATELWQLKLLQSQTTERLIPR
jgi:hypothetical protein